MLNFLIRLFGSKITLMFHDTLVLDRWIWINNFLKEYNNRNSLKLLDVGCGSGAMTIASAKLGFQSLGLSWDNKNNIKAENRAKISNTNNVKFSICDVRNLEIRKDLLNQFDVIICTENIEHIINDQKLMNDMYNCLKIGGMLYLTTPNFYFKPMYGDPVEKINPINPIEDGGHVVIGYKPEDLELLCKNSSFKVIEIGYCSGYYSQKITTIFRIIDKYLGHLIACLVILAFRILPILFDKYIKYENYSITLVAKK